MAAIIDRISINTKQITMRIEMPRLFGIRMWITLRLLRLVAYICPLSITIDTGGDELSLPEHRTYQEQNSVVIPNQMAIGDAHYDADLARRIDVFLNGEKQNAVVAYDVDAGAIRRNVLDSDGKPQLNATRDAVLRETVRGKVEIVLAR